MAYADMGNRFRSRPLLPQSTGSGFGNFGITAGRDRLGAMPFAPENITGTSKTGLSDIRLGMPSDAGPEMFMDIEDLLRQRTPEAIDLIRQGTTEALRLSGRGAQEIEPLRRFGDLSAFEEEQALLGIAGPEAQQAALSGIRLSPAEQEANRRQREMMLRRAAATGDISGQSVLQAGQLGAAQQLASVKNRLAQLAPFAEIARRTRSDLSRQAEAARARRAQLMSGQGTQIANIRLGAVAPMTSAIQQRAELSGLQGISQAQQQYQMQQQLAGLAGQFAPQIQSAVNTIPQALAIYGQTGYAGGPSGVLSGAEFANF